VGACIAALNHFAPASLFDFLLSSSGAVALLVYLAIAISQLRMRRMHGDALSFRMWLFPWATYAVILFISAALAVLLFMPEHRAEATSTLCLALGVSLIGIVIGRRRNSMSAAQSAY
jgi:L-asparagine transporter-like permease